MSKKRVIRVATRPSLLAKTQTEQTVELLKAKNPDIEFQIKTFSTKGDRVLDRSLTQFGTTGLFVKELEMAMLEGEADIAVHSLKDVPSINPPEFILAAYAPRENSCDVLITRLGESLSELKENFILGTGSPRRRVQIAQIRPDVTFKEIRGNIDTRIQKLKNGEYDAILLAAAGMNRLNIPFESKDTLDLDIMTPAIGQGAIAIECLKDDHETIKIVSSINDHDTEKAVLAERAFMAEIEGGCKFPLAAHAICKNDQITMTALVGDGQKLTQTKRTITVDLESSVKTAINLAQELKEECKKLNINYHLF
ncbi:hydroxymethylbilane synthase [Halosquirtibacter xylanolyticus]|uniref:hydroxymethylbilane synthase n=1 Tax=Halosquirtibacter xylanolyticus TaxID=3374599 RepID=UPI00374A7C0C|nr:hydroxymethylbilane synthase [Prolixibacteraceae bacterium]